MTAPDTTGRRNLATPEGRVAAPNPQRSSTRTVKRHMFHGQANVAGSTEPHATAPPGE